MESDVRAAIAYIAGRLILGRDAAFVYDHFTAAKHLFSGDVAPERVFVYDIGRNCYFGGLFNGTQYPLWHYGRSHFVDLKIEGDKFKGFDHSKGANFHGSVTPGEVRICDYSTGGYSLYSV
jgi:hypothetical protein